MQLLILNTRPIEGGGHESLNQIIASTNNKAYSLPLIQTESISFSTKSLNKFQFLIFVSKAAVHGFMRLNKEKIPSTCQCVCIGEATANTLKGYGVHVAYFASDANSESLIAAPIFNEIEDKYVLWIKGNIGRRVIEEGLLAKGAKVSELEVYQSNPVSYPSSKINEIAQLPLDIIIFTSEQSILHYQHLFQNHPHMFTPPCILVLSDRLAILAKKYFRSHILISRHNLIQETIQTYKASL